MRHCLGFKITYPKHNQEVFSADLIIGIEFFPGIDTESYALFIRFDGDTNSTGQDGVFTGYGSLGSRSDFIFGEVFDLQPGPHVIEV